MDGNIERLIVWIVLLIVNNIQAFPLRFAPFLYAMLQVKDKTIVTIVRACARLPGSRGNNYSNAPEQCPRNCI